MESQKYFEGRLNINCSLKLLDSFCFIVFRFSWSLSLVPAAKARAPLLYHNPENSAEQVPF